MKCYSPIEFTMSITKLNLLVLLNEHDSLHQEMTIAFHYGECIHHILFFDHMLYLFKNSPSDIQLAQEIKRTTQQKGKRGENFTR